MAQTESRQIRPVQTESHCNIRIAAQHPLTRTATSVLKLALKGRGHNDERRRSRHYSGFVRVRPSFASSGSSLTRKITASLSAR